MNTGVKRAVTTVQEAIDTIDPETQSSIKREEGVDHVHRN